MKTYNIIKGIFAATVLSVVFSGCSEDAMDRIIRITDIRKAWPEDSF